MDVYHYITTAAYVEAQRRAALGNSQHGLTVLLFSPDKSWAPTSFKAASHPLRSLTREEMVSLGLYRFGAPSRELMPLAELARQQAVDRHAWHGQQQALQAAGVDLAGWRALVGRRSVSDFIIDRFIGDTWSRIRRARWTPAGLVVLDERPIRPGQSVLGRGRGAA